DADDARQFAARVQELRLERIGLQLHLRPALDVEEALAAGDAGIARVADDLHRRRMQDHAHLLAAAGHRHHYSPVLREPAFPRPPPAGTQRETDVRGPGVDGQVRPAAGPGRDRHGQQQAGGQEAGISLHGHQNADRVATPGSTGPSEPNSSTATAPGGMPRYSPDWPLLSNATSRSRPGLWPTSSSRSTSRCASTSAARVPGVASYTCDSSRWST